MYVVVASATDLHRRQQDTQFKRDGQKQTPTLTERKREGGRESAATHCVSTQRRGANKPATEKKFVGEASKVLSFCLQQK